MVPKGAAFFIFIWKINRDPEYYTDPEKFDPDRFLPENLAGQHPYAFVPFSAGPRNCIGKLRMHSGNTRMCIQKAGKKLCRGHSRGQGS